MAEDRYTPQTHPQLYNKTAPPDNRVGWKWTTAVNPPRWTFAPTAAGAGPAAAGTIFGVSYAVAAAAVVVGALAWQRMRRR